MLRSHILLAAIAATLLSASAAQALPYCNTLPLPAPPRACLIAGAHAVCTSSMRCLMPMQRVVAQRCYQWNCAGGAGMTDGPRSHFHHY